MNASFVAYVPAIAGTFLVSSSLFAIWAVILHRRVQNRIRQLKESNLESQRLETELQWAKDWLYKNSQALSALVENAPDVIARFDLQLRHIYINAAIELATGLPPEKFIGKRYSELEIPQYLCIILEGALQKVFQTGEQATIAFDFPSPQGMRSYQVRVAPEFAENGSVEIVLAIAHDITELKQAERTVRQLNRELEQRVALRTAELEAVNRELDAFSYSVSHDLSAPLRHIQGFITALRKKLEDSAAIEEPKVAHYLDVIQKSSEKMGELIDSLLMLSQWSRHPIHFSTVDLRQLVDRAIALLEIPNTESLQNVEFTIGDLPTIQGDRVLLQQVFCNLIDNAVKFSRDRLHAKIEIGMLPDDTVFIRDNGVGFEMQYADRLFGAFQRLHSEQVFEGTGIGLALVHRIITRHQGKIWAESEPDRGTCFYLQFNSENSLLK
ncbi:hypothetical protein TUMEXPCC7403_01550 [Tumidithrix helvetica PCC 7403]|uniref:sensor histidine kinase n=1 Tax=Tumidithrix helvetica TaxID=3457545 RepID=UPI003C9DFFB8